MLNKNDVVTLEITALTNEGSGVGHYGASETSRGMAVFVPLTAVGDVISCRIVKVLKSYAYGRLEAILTASPDRVENYCPVYGKCGGCCFRHISYEAELRAKEGFVRDAFGRIGGLSPEMLPIRGSESVDGYRNKLQMPLSRQDGRTVCGFFSERSHRVLPTEKCALQPEIFAEIANFVTEQADRLRISVYIEEKHEGVLRHIYLRRGHYSGEICLCLVARRKVPEFQKLAKSVTERFPQITGVALNINRENSLRLFVSSYTDSPSITDLQSVYDVSDAQNISHGKPNLKPTYSHRVNFHYTNYIVEKGRTFMWLFSMNTTLDYTAQHLVQRPGDITIDGQAYSPNFYSTTENLDGYWQLRTHLSYGLPSGRLKSNFNAMAGVIYTKTPSILGGTVDAATGMISGGERNDTKNMGYDFRAVLGSNISENVDFTLSWNGTYNEATNSLNADKSKNRYFNHTAQGNLKVVFPLGFTFTASAAYSQYIGFTNDYSEDYLLCNVWLGKKVFKNKRGEVMVGVNDLFTQNRAFSR